MQKVLIANRGEIAVRIIRACRDMGLQTVAVYSEVDREALHVLHADEAICIGEGPSNRSYLKIPHILSACEITGADAVHPAGDAPLDAARRPRHDDATGEHVRIGRDIPRADDRGEEGRGDEHAGGEHGACEHGEAAVDGEGDEEGHRGEARGEEGEGPRELGDRGAGVDALVGVVEGADEIEDAEGGDGLSGARSHARSPEK